MKFLSQKEDGDLSFAPHILEQRNRYIAGLKDGLTVEVAYTVLRSSKTQKQLGAWFGLFCQTVLDKFSHDGWGTELVYRLEKPTGIEIEPEELKYYMYSVVPVFADSKRLGMSKMDTQQMANFFDKCRNYASSQWGIYVPEPNPLWRENK